MNTMLKRVISLILCFVLIAGNVPVQALAAETGEAVTSDATEMTTEPTGGSSEPTEAEVIPVTGISLDQTALEVGVGAEPVTLTATVEPDNASDREIVWTSSEPGVAAVDENGTLTFGYMGEAVITAAAGAFSAECAVTVSEGDWSGYADDSTDYLFIATDRHANTSIIGNIINNMESTIGENELDYLGLGGDMVGSGNDHPAYNSSTVLKEATGATTSLSATNVDIVAGIHDMNVTDDAGIVLPYQGGGAQIYEGDKYYVYGVEEYCISDDSNESNWSTQAQAFVTWANGSGIDQSKVIIVLSHYPLHAKRNDNDGAYYWHQALNTVATGSASGDATVERNIVFFHGHNHTVDSNEYVYNVGDTMSIQNGSSTTSDTIYYTYATAGYLNQNKKATLVTIDSERITLTKYTTSGGGAAVTSVDRVAEAVTLSSIAISGTTEYTVGDELDLTVTATYSDGSTEDVTADAILTGYDMSTAGSYTVTATYEGLTATCDITVKEAATLSSIAVSGTTVYTVGGNGLDLTVTATYSDGTTKDVTADATFEPAELTTSGDHTVTASYGGQTATIAVKAYLYDEDDAGLIGVEAFSQGATALEVTWADAADKVLEEKGTFTDYVVYELALTNPAETTEYAMSIVEGMDTANLAVYHVADDGTLTLVKHTIEDDCIVFTTALTGTFAYGALSVPEGYVLNAIAVSGVKVDYFVNETLDLLDPFAVTATYTKEGAEDYTRKIDVYEENNNPDGYTVDLDSFDMTVAGAYNVRIVYGSVETTFAINVWGDEFTANDVTVHVGEKEYGVTEAVVVESANTHVATAIANVINGDNYVAYDITLNYSEDYAANEADKTVTLPIPEGVTNPVVYYVSDSGKSVVDMKAEITEDGKYVTFTTTHFSTYVVGENISITVPENETATGSGTTTTTTTEEKEVYVLVDSISAAGDYLVVNTNSATTSANLLTASSNGVTNTSGVTVVSGTNDDGNTVIYIESPTAAAIWTASTNGSGYRMYNSSTMRYLRYDNGLTTTNQSKNATTWYSGTNQLYRQGQQNDYWVRYSNGWGLGSANSEQTVYIYQKQTVNLSTTTTTTVNGTYSIEGKDETVVAVKGTTVDLSSILTFTPSSGDATTEDVSATATYEVYDADTTDSVKTGDPLGVISGIDGNTVTLSGKTGKALVKITYTTQFGDVTDYITIEAADPDHYSINLHKAELTKVTVTADTFASGVYYTFNTTTNTYEVAGSYVDGTTYYTAFTEATDVTAANFASGVYYTYNSTDKTYTVADAYKENTTYYTYAMQPGAEITAPLALKGIEKGDTYTVWAIVKAYTSAEDTEGTDIGTLGKALHWTVSDTSIANIDEETGLITFTGTNYGTFEVTVSYEGADGVVITDTITISVTKTLYIVPGDGTNDFPEYPNEGAVRFDKTATAVGNFSETGIAQVELSMTGVPYTTGSEIDVVLMLDITGSMTDVTISSYTYSKYARVEYTILASQAFVESIVVNEDGTYNKNRVGVYSFNSGGTYTLLDLGTISSNDELTAAKAAIATLYEDYKSGGTPYDEGLAKVQSVLSTAKTDGTGNNRQQFAVFMTDGVPTDYEYITGSTHANYSSASSIAGMLTSSDNYCTRDTDYYYEYYSTEMKGDDVTVYTVGIGLENTNSAWSGTAAQCLNLASRLLNDISGPAGESTQPDAVGTSTLSKQDKYFFSVADSDAATEMENVFSNIAKKIMEAATNVVVEDKIGSDYTVNFGLPGYGTSNALDQTALDGLSNFYIQVVEYVLDSTTHERTANYTVKENFTFNFNGTLASHTVDGTACNNCTHVTFEDDGTIIKIEGTYFTYENKGDNDGEFLTWTADKLTSNELALQYFAYLDDSTGVAEADQKDPGTYYTNEYATLTYTNVNGNQVQQEFPIPQMTWYGAQVSYVFYLVNDAGQPVNRAGRVVPFAEAVYVTDIRTEAVVWNDLEQSAGLEAERLADDLVPEVYALYDDDASYNIHVYADEEGTNLNNHFVIGGNVGDDYNTTTNSWTNAKTTYVFNNKSDSIKYNTLGTYIANDGIDTTSTNTYLCKGEGTVSGVTWTEVALASDSDFVTGAYYYDVNGVKTRALTYKEGTTYYKLNTASYTVASGEEQWKPGEGDSTTGGTVINGYVYYVDENGDVYTIVQKSNGNEVRSGFDFANTTVAFAVVWKPRLETDTVVIDYGLDVVIDVTKNDSLAGVVVGVRADAPDGVAINQGTFDSGKETSTDVEITLDGMEVTVGTATVENLTSVRFSLDKDNGMLLNQAAIFYYESDVNYYVDSDLKKTSMYSSVIVIPASTVYYEDEFVDLKTHCKDVNDEDNDEDVEEFIATDGWDINSASVHAVQDTDRPGEGKIGEAYDAENNYGYDSAYDTMSTYSMGSAAKINVYSGKYGTAEFDFYGTGFDVISMTSNTTGVIFVKVFNKEGDQVRYHMVDTYYGYTLDSNGNWSVTESGDNAIYQVPVITVEDLDYGYYRVVITASYNSYFDHNTTDASYDLYLDAIRIYDPVQSGTVIGKDGEEEDARDVTIEDVYAADHEGWPVYQELRNNLIAASDFQNGVVDGALFIDGIGSTSSVSDYISYGPNNEVYLSSGQAIVFSLDLGAYVDENGNSIVDSVQLGMKSANGSTVNYVIMDGDLLMDDNATQSTLTDATKTIINTTTDMYYDITDLKDSAIVIYNAGDGILSLTNIKATFKSAHDAVGDLCYVDYDAVMAMLNNLQTVTSDTDDSDTESTEETTGGNQTDATEETKAIFAPQLTVECPKYVYIGEKYTVTVKTDMEVDSVMVNGVAANSEDKLVWTAELTAGSNTGEEEVKVIAYNEDNDESDPVTAVVIVSKFAPTVSVNATPNPVIKGNAVVVTVTTSNDVAVAQVNDIVLTTYRTTTNSDGSVSRIWTTELNTNDVEIDEQSNKGELTINVTVYDYDGRACSVEEKTVTVNESSATVVVNTIRDMVNSIVNKLKNWFNW